MMNLAQLRQTGTYNGPFFELPFASVSNRVFVRNHSYENEFPLQVHFHHTRSGNVLHEDSF